MSFLHWNLGSCTNLTEIVSFSLNLPTVNYYHKELHLECCSSPRSASTQSNFFVVVVDCLFTEKKMKFSIMEFSVIRTKLLLSCGFGHIYWKKSLMELLLKFSDIKSLCKCFFMIISCITLKTCCDGRACCAY